MHGVSLLIKARLQWDPVLLPPESTISTVQYAPAEHVRIHRQKRVFMTIPPVRHSASLR